MKVFWREVRLIVANDLRQQWRGNRASTVLNWSVIGAFCLILHFATIVLFNFFRTPPAPAVEAAIWWFFILIMMGTAMNSSISALYERADFDLLLSSPVSPRAVLCARLGAAAASGALAVVMFAPPLLNPAVFVYGPRYLAGYVVWALLALAAAAAGTIFTMGLVRLLGARRARTVGQVLGALVGASAYLAGQLPNILRNTVGVGTMERIYGRLAGSPVFLLPAQAGRGQPLALALLGLLTAGLAGLTIWLLARNFVSGVQEVASIPARRARAGHVRWHEGLGRATFWKDFRLIARDPLLFAQTLPNLAMLVPVGLSTYKGLGIGSVALMVFMGCLLLASSLTTVSVAGEECWDLIRMSPAAELRMRAAKVAAGMAVPVLILIVASIALAAAGRPWLGLLTAAVSTVCMAGICSLSVSTVIPTPRRDLLKARRGGGSRGSFKVVCATIYLMGTGGGGLALAAWGAHPVIAAVVLGLALLGSAVCLGSTKFEAITWRDEEPA